MQVQSLGWEDSLEDGTAIHCSVLAWRIPQTEELQSRGLNRVGYNLENKQQQQHTLVTMGY